MELIAISKDEQRGTGTKSTVMEKAEELFALQGYNNTTISQIAKASNVGEATIYNHFQNKEDLLFSIPERYISNICDSLERHLLGIRGADHKLSKIIWHYLMFMEENQESARLFIMSLWSNIRFYQSKRSAPVLRYLALIRRVLKEGVREGVFRHDLDIFMYQCTLLGTVNDIMLSQVIRNRPIKLLPKGDVLEETLLKIVAPDAEDNLQQQNPGKKRAILMAALHEFGRNGYAETKISQISTRAGITDPTLYEYFKSKEDILMSIPQLAVEELFSDLNIDINQINNPENVLKIYLWNQMKSYETYPSYSNVLIKELRCNPKFYESPGYAIVRKYTDDLISILNWGIKTGDFKSDLNIDITAHMYFGTLDQLLLYKGVNPSKLRITEKTQTLFDMLIRILKP